MVSQKVTSWEQKAKDFGIDISLIEANLLRTYTERIEVLQHTLDTIDELRKAWEHEQHQRNPTNPSRE